MNAERQTVCLCMIVKDEAPVIRRCLDSVRPIIDHWVIVDTGSTDGTQDLIREHMRDLPGQLFERPWVDFAWNRSEALVLARDRADYTFVIDADDTLEITPGFEMPTLTADAYDLEIIFGQLQYWRPHIIRNALPWRFRGVVHEFLTCEGAERHENLSGLRIRVNEDGARRRDPDTYRRDVAVLEKALLTETDPFLVSRYVFYLAQGYRDCGEKEKAIAKYLERAALGFWDQEVFISLYRAAQLMEDLGSPPESIITTYVRAFQAVPTRAEALHGASRYCRLHGRFEDGYLIAKAGLALELPPPGALFLEPWIYEYGLQDEYALNAHWAGHYRESLDAFLKMLMSETLPPAQIKRIAENARFPAALLHEECPAQKLESIVARNLHSRLPDRVPTVLIAVYDKRKKTALDLCLQCIEALDYPKSSVSVDIRWADENPISEHLSTWLRLVRDGYASVDAGPLYEKNEVNSDAPGIPRDGRKLQLERATKGGFDFCLVVESDNFLSSATLKELVATGLPIVSPLLRCVDSDNPLYANYHAAVNESGYYRESKHYREILFRSVRGLVDVPAVHSTYLVRSDVVDRLSYVDGSGRHEYVVFAESARRAGITQYLDNRQVYGYLTLEDTSGAIQAAAKLLGDSDSGANSVFRSQQIRSTAESVKVG